MEHGLLIFQWEILKAGCALTEMEFNFFQYFMLIYRRQQFLKKNQTPKKTTPTTKTKSRTKQNHQQKPHISDLINGGTLAELYSHGSL